MADTLDIDNGQIIIAIRVDDITYALGTEQFDKLDILVNAAKNTLEKLNG